MCRPNHVELPALPHISLEARHHRDLSAPTQSPHRHMLIHGRPPQAHLLSQRQKRLYVGFERSRAVPERRKALLLFGRVRRQPVMLDVVTLEKIWNEHECVAQEMGETIGTLQGLRAEAEDIVDGDGCPGGGGGASDV